MQEAEQHIFLQDLALSSCILFVNSLAPGKPRCHFKTAIFNLILLIGILTSSNDNPLRWMPWDLTDDKSTLVQVMAWCLQATSHYLSQCWPSSMSPYGFTRPQWVQWVSIVPIMLFMLIFLFFLLTHSGRSCQYFCFFFWLIWARGPFY